MTVEVTMLQSKFAELLRWERQKRREQILLLAAGVALALAVLLSPLHILLPLSGLRWIVPILLLVGLVPLFFYYRRWRPADATRAVVALDRQLGLDERAVTAWELAGRGDQSAAAQLVFRQSESRLRSVQPRSLFPRQWAWPAYTVAPLLLFWFALLWFDFDQPFSQQPSVVAQGLAQKLREFARDFQEKARTEGLRESLQLGQELEKLAQKNLADKANDEQLKKDLAGVKQKLDAAGKSGQQSPSIAGAESEQSLKDLRAELEAARDMLNLPDGVKAPQQWMDRLASMPQLGKQLDRARQEREDGKGLGQQELQSLLDRLDQQVAGALDRRALIDAQQYLEQMMQQGQGQGKENNHAAQMAGRGEQDEPGDGVREKNHSNLPGKEPGKNDDRLESLPGFRADTRTQIKGQLGEGESSGVMFKGKPTPGKSALAPQDVVADYRRQAEQELNSEKVPAALKETVRKYFLSLEESRK
jgi:hypothetical protein